MPREHFEIDRDKLRAAIRQLGSEYVFYMLDDAIDFLPPAKLHKIVKKYVDLGRLRPDAERATKASALTEVRIFEKASLSGDFYESFKVNSTNYTQKSAGTTAWIPNAVGSWSDVWPRQARRTLRRFVRASAFDEATVGFDPSPARAQIFKKSCRQIV